MTAVRGLGERLVGGEAAGDQWRVRDGTATAERIVEDAVSAEQAVAVADAGPRTSNALLGGAAGCGVGDRTGQRRPARRAAGVWLLQARPMTALPEPVDLGRAGAGVVDAQLPPRRVAARADDPAVRRLAAATDRERVLGRDAGQRRSCGAVPLRGGQRLVLQQPSLTQPAAAVPGAHRRAAGGSLPVLSNALVGSPATRSPPTARSFGRLDQHWRTGELPRLPATRRERARTASRPPAMTGRA